MKDVMNGYFARFRGVAGCFVAMGNSLSMSEVAKRGMAATLLLLFVTYFASITVFSHTHHVDGATIVHSHIHTQNHADGDHTSEEIAFIKVISIFIATQTPLSLGVEPLFPVMLTICYCVSVSSLCLAERLTLSLRGPPAQFI